MAVNKKRLSSGYDVPVLGFGTYFGLPQDFKADDVTKCIESAIDIGYRHIDTALLYQTERMVGQAVRNKIKDGTVKRGDLFITTKLHSCDHLPADARSALTTSLRNLDVGYIDLFLIHTPHATKKVHDGRAVDLASPFTLEDGNDHLETWKVLEEAVDRGDVRSIGVSNFSKRQLENLLKNGRVKPAMNQVEVQPYFANTQLIDFCRQNDIVVTAYTPLGQPHSSWAPKDWVSPLQHPTIHEIAAKHNKSAAQVALKFQLQRGLVVLVKATSSKRQQENIQLFDFTLTSEDMTKMEDLNRNDRVLDFFMFKDHKDYPFNDPY